MIKIEKNHLKVNVFQGIDLEKTWGHRRQTDWYTQTQIFFFNGGRLQKKKKKNLKISTWVSSPKSPHCLAINPKGFRADPLWGSVSAQHCGSESAREKVGLGVYGESGENQRPKSHRLWRKGMDGT